MLYFLSGSKDEARNFLSRKLLFEIRSLFSSSNFSSSIKFSIDESLPIITSYVPVLTEKLDGELYVAKLISGSIALLIFDTSFFDK